MEDKRLGPGFGSEGSNVKEENMHDPHADVEWDAYGTLGWL